MSDCADIANRPTEKEVDEPVYSIAEWVVGPVENVPVADLAPGETPRLCGVSDSHVDALFGCETTFPPVLVHRPTMRVIDGAHRLRAACRRGETTIRAQFFDGSAEDAFVLGVRQNVAHGLPLSSADRQAAAERIMVTHPQWSDRMVATATGLSAGSVARLRRRASAPIEQLDARIGRDGRVRPIDLAPGRIRAGELLRERPTAPLRTVAAAAGISVNTARDVRRRLARGADPVPSSRRRDESSDAAARRTADARYRRHDPSARPDPAALRARLTQDPSLRLSEAGRTLLRLLHIVAMSEHERCLLLSSVPPHCRRLIADLASGCAESWADAATRLSHED